MSAFKTIKFTRTSIKKEGKWPKEFLENLIGVVPSVFSSRDSVLYWNCPNHGDYSLSIDKKLRSLDRGISGCPICAKIHRSKINGINASKAEGGRVGRRAKNPFPDCFLKDLEGSPDKEAVIFLKKKVEDVVQFNCYIHGPYYQTIHSHLSGRGCPLCSLENQKSKFRENMRAKNPFPKWFLKLIETSPDREDILGLKKGIKDYVTLICSKHGPYKQSLQHAMEGHICPTCAAHQCNWSSSFEKKLEQDLNNIGVRVIRSCRSIIKSNNGRNIELDLFLPDFNLAIEVNGLYWHSFERMQESDSYNLSESKALYHKTKTELCKEKGIQLIHLFEDDLTSNYQLCFNLILSKIHKLHTKTLAARKCECRIITNNEAREFYSKYHIQGYGYGKHAGLFYKGYLLSCMAVKKGASNTSSIGAWELNRYASINNYFIMGGFEKLFKFLGLTYHITHWISYADLTVSDGSLYHHHNWTFIKELPVDYKYIYHKKRYHKFNFRISRYKKDPDLEYQEGLTEFQLAALNGIERIYDCGKLKFEKLTPEFK